MLVTKSRSRRDMEQQTNAGASSKPAWLHLQD